MEANAELKLVRNTVWPQKTPSDSDQTVLEPAANVYDGGLGTSLDRSVMECKILPKFPVQLVWCGSSEDHTWRTTTLDNGLNLLY